MRVTCNREDLLSAFQMVSGVVPARSRKPILLNVTLIARPDGAVLLATDLEVGIRCNVAGLVVHEPGELVLPMARVSAILRESSDAQLDMETDESRLQIRG